MPLSTSRWRSCISAGADMAAIESWIEEGRLQAAAARRVPFGRPGRARPVSGLRNLRPDRTPIVLYQWI